MERSIYPSLVMNPFLHTFFTTCFTVTQVNICKSPIFINIGAHLLTRTAGHTQAVPVPHQLRGLLIHFHEADWVHIGQDAAVEPTSSHLVSGEDIKKYLIRQEDPFM